MRQTSRPVFSRWSLPRWALLCLLLSAVSAGIALAEAAGEQTEGELRALVDQLFSSVAEGDDAGVDAATCLGDIVYASLERERALGLVTEAAEPELLAQRKDEARASVHAFVERLLETGKEIESTDVSRVELFTGPDKTGEVLRGEGRQELEITAGGVLGIKMLTSQRMVDVDVSRLQDRWCLNPLSMQ